MKLSTVLAGRTFTFQSVKEVLAKANEEKSGDILAGVAAKQVLSELLVRDLRENPVVPYVVPPGGLSLAAGAVVDNIATIYAISQAMEGIPFTQKILTVTGEVAHPVVLSMPVGTSFRACLPLVAPGDSVRAGSSSPSRWKAPWGR